MKKALFLTVLLITLFAVSVFATEYADLDVLVCDDDSPTNEPIAGAIVTIVELEVNLTTGTNGKCYFEDLPVGSYTITTDADGYTTYQGEVQIGIDGIFIVKTKVCGNN